MISGVETEGLLDVAKRKAGGKVFSEGVSVGCGNGWKEMELIRGGLVQFFHLFELSEVRIQHGNIASSYYWLRNLSSRDFFRHVKSK